MGSSKRPGAREVVGVEVVVGEGDWVVVGAGVVAVGVGDGVVVDDSVVGDWVVDEGDWVVDDSVVVD
ncbi:hypothetical protein [Nocardia iowensis]|uniref:Uncharacterized protein n=1 Tax=Nocardia iowensis TaxID=204891 RepID=A0ABX8RWI8_NOCIO|nr:hypothetical protein [Nocardia iowensis]QXN94029.1 hypothetical protein KV110_13775 [Nocardia iowensis]